ncbi:ester cyclase, partial [Acidobacteriota bacterium]
MKKLCMILPLALILCFMVGCEDRASLVELEKFQAQAEVEEQNEAIYRHFTEEMNKGYIEFARAVREVCAPELTYYAPSRTTSPISLEEIIEAFKMYFQGFPDHNIVIQEVVAKGDKIIARVTFTGTHTGEWSGIPATGNKIKSSTIEIWHMKDGKCVEIREETDYVGFYEQLG